MKRTTGDQYQVECPVCGKIIRDLWDLSDGLCAGAQIDCEHCGEDVTVEAVDITVDVTLVANAGGQRPPASGGTSEPHCSQSESKGKQQ